MANNVVHTKEKFDLDLTPANYDLAACIAKILKCSIAQVVLFCFKGLTNPCATSA